MKALLLSLAIAAGCLATDNARAEFYKYKDSSGGLVITNRLEDVPKKYRKKVKVVWDDDLTAKDPHARRSAAAEARRVEQERNQAPQKEKQGGGSKPQSSDGKRLVVTFDEETGQVIKTME